MATLLFQECPLTVIVTGGRVPPPSASTTSGRNFQAPHGLRWLNVGSKLHDLLLPCSTCRSHCRARRCTARILREPVGQRSVRDLHRPVPGNGRVDSTRQRLPGGYSA